jgi:hypothetical protein
MPLARLFIKPFSDFGVAQEKTAYSNKFLKADPKIK